MTDETREEMKTDQAEPAENNTDETAFWRNKFAESVAREAIIAEGGQVDLLMPHVMPTITLDRDADGISIACNDGSVSENPGSFVRRLRDRDGFSNAFETSPKAGAAVIGSGAQTATSVSAQTINASDPLAVGHALVAIARGERVLSD